jgi:hypothetical protein
VQKFTRPITREIEFAGLRLAVTFGEQGIGVRPVGSRRPPREISWPAFLAYLTGRSAPAGQEPTPDEMTAAANAFKSPQGSGRRSSDSEEAGEEGTAPHQGEAASAPQPAAHGAEFHSTPGTP